MPDPSGYWCPKLAATDLYMFSTGAPSNKSIEEAIYGCLEKPGADPGRDDFDEMKTAMTSDLKNMLEGSYKGTSPIETEHFRGFPKPTVDVAFTVQLLTGGAQRLDADITLLYGKVGYDLTIRISGSYTIVTGTDANGEISVAYDITIPAGNAIYSHTTGGIIPDTALGTKENILWDSLLTIEGPNGEPHYTGTITDDTGNIYFIDPSYYDYTTPLNPVDLHDCALWSSTGPSITGYHFNAVIAVNDLIADGPEEDADGIGSGIWYYTYLGDPYLITTNSSGTVTVKTACPP